MSTHLDLFSGIGGMSIAAEMAGIQTVAFCEWADYPTKILEKHWPDVPRWRDIRTLTGESFYERTGLRTVDIISGGFPCQPFSCAGKRRGKDDDRYLWDEMLRVIDEIKPTWVIGENVAGIVSMAEPDRIIRVESNAINRYENEDYYETTLSQQERMLLVGIIGSLERIGYEVQSFVIPACGVDAPHQRYRIAIVGYSEHNGLSSAAVAGSIRKTGNDQPERPHQAREFAGAGRSGNGQNVADTKIERCDHGNDSPDERQADRKVNAPTNAGLPVSNVSDTYNGRGTMWRNWQLSAVAEAERERNDH